MSQYFPPERPMLDDELQVYEMIVYHNQAEWDHVAGEIREVNMVEIEGPTRFPCICYQSVLSWEPPLYRQHFLYQKDLLRMAMILFWIWLKQRLGAIK